MKAIVAVKRVLDFNVRVRIKSDHSDVDLTNLKMSMNPFDEIAVEQVVKHQEEGLIKESIAVSIGPKEAEGTLRHALALGIDKGIHVLCSDPLEPLMVAKILKVIAEREKPTYVILGKQAIDDDCNQTGQMLAGLLDWPQATFASKITLTNTSLTVEREVDQGIVTLNLSPPAILTTDLRLNVPRYASLPNIMKAKKKPIETITLQELNIVSSRRLNLIEVKPPPGRAPGVKLKSAQELVDKLVNEVKVIGS